jgi:DNA-binding LacI/PurR family transcriptional regulator
VAATMKDVAERAGVSIATVSFVVNNSKRVTPDTRERIERAMSELGFRRNIVARALASRRTRIIALLYPTLERSVRGTVSDFVASAAQAASDADYHLVIWPDRGDLGELDALIGQGLVDGVLVMEVALDDPRVEKLRQLNFPFASIGRTRDTTGLYCVDIDFDTSLRIAMDYLEGLGHREIVLVSGSRGDETADLYGPHVRTLEAYHEAAAARGITPIVMLTAQSVISGRTIAQRLAGVAPNATAVIVRDDAAAAGVVAGLQGRGLAVPGDISVLSLLSSREMASVCHPPLTFVSAPGQELGRLGVEALLRQLDGAAPSEPLLRTGVLELGESTGLVSGSSLGPRSRHE